MGEIRKIFTTITPVFLLFHLTYDIFTGSPRLQGKCVAAFAAGKQKWRIAASVTAWRITLTAVIQSRANRFLVTNYHCHILLIRYKHINVVGIR